MSAPNVHTKIFQSTAELNKAAAEFIITLAKKAIAENGRCVIALSGGKTPETLYALLAEPDYSQQMDWKNIYIFWGDERYVPLDDEQNNAHQAISVFLSKVDIPPDNIHRIPVNLYAAEAASVYENEINHFFNGDVPVFDLILLGVGTNGHTASLFPDTHVLLEQTPGVKAVYVEDQKSYRITMTAPLINLARHVLFLVTGNEKAEIVKNIFATENNYPAQLINPANGKLHWFIDEAAASDLKK